MKGLLTTLLCAAALIASHSVSAQIGVLDSDWDADGIRIDSFFNNTMDRPQAVRVQPDGKVVVCGFSDIQGDIDMTVIRYNLDGTPDITFSGDGMVNINLGNGFNDYAYNMALQADGKVLLCGITDSSSAGGNAMIVVRLRADGLLDSAFGVNGVVTINPNKDYSAPYAIAVNNTTGKIAISGDLWGDFFIMQLNSDGTMDNSYGTSGKVVALPATGYGFTVTSLAYQPDGKLVSSGHYAANGDIAFYANRFNTDGTVDNSFSVDGIVTTKMTSTAFDRCYGMALQADGKIILAGYDYDAGVASCALVRYNADGTLDLTFNGTGKLVQGYSTYSTAATGITIAADGKYLISCDVTVAASTYRCGVARFNTDGTKDTYFGTGGLAVTNVANYKEQASKGIAQAPDGKIVTVNEAGGTNLTGNYATTRYLSGLHVGITDLHTTATAALIYPNPIQQAETLRYTLSTDEKVSIALYGTDGKLMQEFIAGQPRTSGENVETLSFSSALAAGTYILTLHTTQGDCSIQVVK